MKILVTGGCGFIGSNFIRMLLAETDVSLINLDKLTYAGNPENIADVVPELEPSGENILHSPDRKYTFVRGDICNRELVADILSDDVDAIINFAAESHVDRSIMSSDEFVATNIRGVTNLLDCAREKNIQRFIQVSTDEVYGTLQPDDPPFRETNRLQPNSPYSASKAAGDLICRSYFRTHCFPVIITRCSNNYGPYQFPEKLIPLMISNALEDSKLPVYGDGMQIRDWIHVGDHCRALWTVLKKGREGEVYNIGGNNEQYNIDIVRLILKELDKPEDLVEFVKDRPGHDRRYAIDSTKMMSELGWKPETAFENGLRDTVSWYIEHHSWSENIKDSSYREYYDKQYKQR